MMPAAAAARPQPEFAQRQIRIVHHHQQARSAAPDKTPPPRPTASPLEFIYVCGSHSSTRRLVALRGSQPRVELLLVSPARPPALGQPLGHQETRIVPGPRVIRAGIAQAHDEIQVLHARGRVWQPGQAPGRHPNYFFFSGRRRAFFSAPGAAFLSAPGAAFSAPGAAFSAPLAGAFSAPLAAPFSAPLAGGGAFFALFLLLFDHLDLARDGFRRRRQLRPLPLPPCAARRRR